MKRSARHKFTIYIARGTRRSDLALQRLTNICEEEIPGEYEIEVVDLAKRPDLARDRQIIATPAVFRMLPAPVRKSIGDLSDKDKAILGLDLLIRRKLRRITIARLMPHAAH